MNDLVEFRIGQFDQIFLDVIIAFDRFAHLGCPPCLVIGHEGLFRDVAFCQAVRCHLGCKPAGVHRVVDAAAGKGVDDPGRITGDQETVCDRAVQRPADRDTAGDILDCLSVREGLLNEPVKIVLCPVAFPALPSGDADPDICGFPFFGTNRMVGIVFIANTPATSFSLSVSIL